jgi:branched-chain amino acid transport system substrate-binding protein
MPFANGYVDYLKLVNAQGGINGVKVSFEECETGYATDKGVECYERLKGKGATVFQPLSTGITFALTEKAPADKIPLITAGYGRSESGRRLVFKWNFPLTGTYWVAADILVQHIGKKEGGLDKLKGKKIALVYHDSPYGKEPIPLLQERSKMHGFDLQLLPVTHPGVEQKATWLQIRQSRPDYVFLWGWGVMNSTALKEAVATGYPRDKMYGVWWSGAEPDVKDVGDGAKGYNALAHAARRRAELQDRQGRPGAGARQGPGHRARRTRSARCCTCAACLRRCWRSKACARAGALRQGQGHDRRAGALGPTRTWRSTRRSSTRWASPA